MVKNYGRICSLVAPIRAQSKVRSDLKVGRFSFVARKSVSLPAQVLALGTHSQWPIGDQCTRSAYGALNKDGIFGNAIEISPRCNARPFGCLGKPGAVKLWYAETLL